MLLLNLAYTYLSYQSHGTTILFGCKYTDKVNYDSCKSHKKASLDFMHFHYILFQVPVIQLLLGQVGLVSGDQMLSIWRYVVVGAVVAAAVLTPSTDPLTQMLLAGPLLGLYLGGAWMVKLIGR